MRYLFEEYKVRVVFLEETVPALLSNCVEIGDLPRVEYLLELGANVYEVDPSNGNFCPFNNPSLDMVDLFWRYGFDLQTVNSENKNIMSYADDPKLKQWLIDHGLKSDSQQKLNIDDTGRYYRTASLS